MAGSYPADETYQDRPRRRLGRRLLISLIILLFVLAGLLTVADRVAAGVAERAITDRVSQEIAKQDVKSTAPEVSVGGFPFLTQVVAGKYQSISILLHDVQGPLQGRAVRIPELDIEARNVVASLDTLRSGHGEVIAETVEGTGTIDYDSVARLIDQPGLKLAESNGKLTVTAPLNILGQQITAHGTAKLGLEDSEVLIGFDELSADGLAGIPGAQALVNTFAKQISLRFTLPTLPFELRVRQVRALPDGLAVTADAHERAAELGWLTRSAVGRSRFPDRGRPCGWRCHAGKLPLMGIILTKRRAVDLCRVATCLCRPVI